MKLAKTTDRKEKRIKHPFNLKFRTVDDAKLTNQWDTTIVKDISKNGIFFNSSYEYTPGAELELKLNHPGIDEQGSLWGLVVRSNRSHPLDFVYETAVFIYKADKTIKESFNTTMDFFLKNQ